jgi:hypothetical protein
MAKVWVWLLEDEVSPEIPAAGGDWTSAFWIVNECEWLLALVEVKVLLVVGGVGPAGLEPHFIRPVEAKIPANPPNPARKKSFLVMRKLLFGNGIFSKLFSPLPFNLLIISYIYK